MKIRQFVILAGVMGAVGACASGRTEQEAGEVDPSVSADTTITSDTMVTADTTMTITSDTTTITDTTIAE